MAITISGQNNNDKILASDGVLDQISGFNVVGVMTATTFDVTGKTTTNHISIGNNIHLGNAGIITATTLLGNVTGNINHESNLLLQISGSEKFRVGNGGQFGIAGANYGTAGQVFTSGGSGSAPTWSTIASDKITEGNTEAEVVDTGSDGYFKVTTEGSERLRVDASGDVLIGTTDDLIYNNSSGEGVVIRNGDCIDVARNSDGQLYLNRMGSDGAHVYFYRDGVNKTSISTRNSAFCIDINNSEKLRVDTSGDVLIGTTDDSVYNNSSGEGVVIRGGDCIDIARNNDNQLFLNRQGGDGYHIAFIRDGSYKSFISTRSNTFCIDVAGSERFRITDNGNVNINSSGVSSPYAGNGSSTGFRHISINNNLLLNAQNAAGGFAGMQNNAYLNSSGQWVRVNNDYATSIGTDDGVFYFRNAGAGTGTISWSTPFQINANGASTFNSTLTVNGYVLSQGTSGRGGIFGQIQVGYSTLYNSIQNSVANTPIHLQYNNTGDVKCNEGGGDLRTADIIPHTNNSSNLGSSTRRWANIHTNDLNLSNEGSANDVDGTWGQYTIQEGQDNLFLINRRNGKRYKFLLQEID